MRPLVFASGAGENATIDNLHGEAIACCA